jgi:hypothetical protein
MSDLSTQPNVIDGLAVSPEPSGDLAPGTHEESVRLILRDERGPEDLEETRAALRELARRKCEDVPLDLLVEQVLRVTQETDWPTRRAAMEALLRRVGFAERDEFRVVERPDRSIRGLYRLARHEAARRGRGREAPRPYKTELIDLAPFRGSCDCADFLHGSLGICKHLIAVLKDIHSSARRKSLAERERGAGPALRSSPRLCWNPVRDYRGPGDRLSGLSIAPGTDEASSRSLIRLKPWTRYFSEGAPQPAALADLASRKALLSGLIAAVDQNHLDADPAARQLLDEELFRAIRRIEGAGAAPSILAHLRSLRRKLYPYQVEGVRRFVEAKRLLLADDMGLGKTTQAVAACHALFASRTVARGLLIVPASLKSQWIREWSETSDTPVSSVDGSPEDRARLYRSTKNGFLVINYEQLLRDFEAVQRFAPELVVLDEAQRIKNWATKSSAYVKALSPEWRLVLTGTPMENRLEELASVLDWIDEVALTPKWRLGPWHTVFQGDGGKGRVGARNLETLRDRLAPCLVRRVRKEVLAQLPSRTDTRVPVEMTEQQRRAHDELSMPIAQLVRRGQQRPLSQPEFLRLMQMLTTQRVISNGIAQLRFEEMWPALSAQPPDEALLESALAPKLLELRRLVLDLVKEQRRKVVVFSQWRAMLRLSEWAIRDLLQLMGARALFFTGAESQKLRTQSVIEFHDDPDARVMFLSDAGGVGLNLQRAASACINLEIPWNPAVLEQRIGRIYRLGQVHPIDVYSLVSECGIEARIASLVANKKALFSGLFDGTSDAVQFDSKGGFLSQVERLLEPVKVPEIPEALEGAEAGSEVDAKEESDLASADLDGAPAALEGGGALEAGAVVHGAAEAARVGADEVREGGTGGPGADTAEGRARALLGAGAGEPPFQISTSLGASLRQLRVSREADGTVRIEAPPSAAEDLIGVFEGLASLLRSSRVEGK